MKSTLQKRAEEQLDEHILRLPSGEAAALFGGRTCLDHETARHLIALFVDKGRFVSRNAVEADETVVQALPVVVVRNRSGNVLRLRRRERRHANPLHEKVVIWAGGHVRREDGGSGRSIEQCAIRELQEELRLSVEEEELALLGAVWIRAGTRPGFPDKTSRHVAVVFEWRAQTDDVAVALSATEFFERRGTSLSGTFVSESDLAADIDNFLPEVADRQVNPSLL